MFILDNKPREMDLNLQKLTGNWNWGRSLNIHTISSTPIEDEHGNITWDTTRTDIGEELYRLKYWDENPTTKAERVEKIAREVQKVLAKLLQKIFERWRRTFKIDCIIPVPPSKSRRYQPVEEMARRIAELSNIPLDLTNLKKIKSTLQLKDIEDSEKRKKVLERAFDIREHVFQNKNVLVFDDLYRSGATLNAITKVLKNKGRTKNVFVLTVTKTRSKR